MLAEAPGCRRHDSGHAVLQEWSEGVVHKAWSGQGRLFMGQQSGEVWGLVCKDGVSQDGVDE